MVATVATMTIVKNAVAVPHVHRDYTAAAQTVSADTLIFTLPVSGMKRLMVQLTAAVAALTALTIGVIPNAGGSASTIASIASDFTNPAGLMIGASGDLTILAASTGWFILDVEGLDSVIITADSGGTATLSLAAGGE